MISHNPPEPKEIQAKAGDRFVLDPALDAKFEQGTETENEVTIVIVSKEKKRDQQ
jgi:hypothetical protein